MNHTERHNLLRQWAKARLSEFEQESEIIYAEFPDLRPTQRRQALQETSVSNARTPRVKKLHHTQTPEYRAAARRRMRRMAREHSGPFKNR